MKKIFLLNPRGPCAGVNRAIDILNKALEKYGAPIFVNHEIVHNETVVQEFEKKGVIFCKTPEEVPKNGVYIFSAHGVAPSLRQSAEEKNLKIIDATCPLVEKVHNEAKYFLQNGYTVFYIGKKNHPESNGVRDIGKMVLIENKDQAKKIEIDPNEKIVILTQTTLSVDETSGIINILKTRFTNIKTPKVSDICYATQNRQQAVKNLVSQVELLLVVGSEKSSNSKKLVQVGKSFKCDSFLISHENKIPWKNIQKVDRIAITSGASVPEKITKNILALIQKKFSNIKIEEVAGEKENLSFPLPRI